MNESFNAVLASAVEQAAIATLKSALRQVELCQTVTQAQNVLQDYIHDLETHYGRV